MERKYRVYSEKGFFIEFATAEEAEAERMSEEAEAYTGPIEIIEAGEIVGFY